MTLTVTPNPVPNPNPTSITHLYSAFRNSAFYRHPYFGTQTQRSCNNAYNYRKFPTPQRVFAARLSVLHDFCTPVCECRTEVDNSSAFQSNAQPSHRSTPCCLQILISYALMDQSQRSVRERNLHQIELALICESHFRKYKTFESGPDTRESFLSKVTFESYFRKKLSSVSWA